MGFFFCLFLFAFSRPLDQIKPDQTTDQHYKPGKNKGRRVGE